MNPLFYLLLPLFFLGATCLAVLFLLLLFFLIKYFKSKKKIYIILSLGLVAIFLYASVDIAWPRAGRVLNALDNQPVSGLTVVRVFQTTNMVLNPGGESARVKWWQTVMTDATGTYKLPIYFHVKVPFLSALTKVTVGAPICAGDEDGFLSHCPYPFDREINYDNRNFESAFTTASLTINGDIYLVPKVTDLKKCDALVVKQLIGECQSANAIRSAVKNLDINLCSYAGNRLGCILTAAAETRNGSFCDLIDTSESDKISCLRNVATAKQDRGGCQEIPNSQWQSTTDNLGNQVERCVQSAPSSPLQIIDNDNLLRQ